MKQLVTAAIILNRTDYGEADRIITVLTPEHGKLRLMAKGVRRVKSKLAGGIELFSVSSLTYMQGKSELGTLLSSRLQQHYGNIVRDITRTMLGYELIKQLNKVTEDQPEADYFELLHQAFAALDTEYIDVELIRLWFAAQLLRLAGYTPNLQTEPDGAKLTSDQQYEFSYDDSAFISRPDGGFAADDIKFLRLLFAGTQPAVLAKVSNANALSRDSNRIIRILEQQLYH